jgi:hypothetical protein
MDVEVKFTSKLCVQLVSPNQFKISSKKYIIEEEEGETVTNGVVEFSNDILRKKTGIQLDQ